jgi:hypothetical protein
MPATVPLPLAQEALDRRALGGHQALDGVADRGAPPGAAVLALGEHADPDFALQVERFEDRGVLGLVQLFGRQPVLPVFFPRLEELRGPEQAADMVGSKR